MDLQYRSLARGVESRESGFRPLAFCIAFPGRPGSMFVHSRGMRPTVSLARKWDFIYNKQEMTT